MARWHNSKALGYWNLNKLIKISKRCRNPKGPEVMYKTRVRFDVDNYSIIIRHYATDIATITPHEIHLHPNGWWSHVTKKRLNYILADNNTNAYISYKNGVGTAYDENWMRWTFERDLIVRKRNKRWKFSNCVIKTKYMRTKTKALLICRALVKILSPLGLHSATDIANEFYWHKS